MVPDIQVLEVLELLIRMLEDLPMISIFIQFTGMKMKLNGFLTTLSIK
jgi:hypothetical protein